MREKTAYIPQKYTRKQIYTLSWVAPAHYIMLNIQLVVFDEKVIQKHMTLPKNVVVKK